MVALGVGSIILDVGTLGGASIAKGAIKTGIKAGGRSLGKKIGKALPRGGKSFKEYRKAFWKGKNKPRAINQTDGQGNVWKTYQELHHRFIPQRIQKEYDLPNWLINNRINLQKLDGLEHAKRDPYRARFAPAWAKNHFNLKWK